MADMKITNMEELEAAILEMEAKKNAQHSMLLSQFHQTYESLKPANIILDTFNRIIEPGETRSSILKAAGSIGIGLISEKLLAGKTSAAIGNLISNGLNYLTTTTLGANSTDKIKAYGKAICNNLFKKETSA
jgi:hypothetical protein